MRETHRSPFDKLSQESVLQILYRLRTAKDAHRLKLVCKSWGDLISQPSFAYQFLQKRKRNVQEELPSMAVYMGIEEYQGRVVRKRRVPFPDITDPVAGTECCTLYYDNGSRSWSFDPSTHLLDLLPFPDEGIRFQGSSHGLLLCCLDSADSPSQCCVCNPLTKDYVLLPEGRPARRYWVYEYLGIVCTIDYTAEKNTTGFKVVRQELIVPHYPKFQKKDNPSFQIFDSGTGEWREQPVSFSSPISFCSNTMPVEIKGILFRVAYMNNVYPWKYGVAAYDVSHHPDHCRYIPFPPDEELPDLRSRWRWRTRYQLESNREELVLLTDSRHSSASGDGVYFVLWRLKSIESGVWVLEHKFLIDGRLPAFLSLDPINRILLLCTASKRSGKQDYRSFLDIPRRIYSLDMETREAKILIRDIEQHHLRIDGTTFRFCFPDWPTAVPSFKIRESQGEYTKASQPKDEEEGVDEESDDEHGETLCGTCGEKYGTDEFWICCNVCETWFHGKCVEITPVKHIMSYKCPWCGSRKART